MKVISYILALITEKEDLNYQKTILRQSYVDLVRDYLKSYILRAGMALTKISILCTKSIIVL